MANYSTLRIDKTDRVATITMLSRATGSVPEQVPPNLEMATAFNELQWDNTVRVIVLTGSDEQFKIPPRKEYYESDAHKGVSDSIRSIGVVRVHQIMAEIEKPIVAKVNGDAIGFGQSLAFASDIIIAREDARFIDHHMGGVFSGNYGGETREGGHDVAIVPGDGGAALVPLFMSPCKAKEYLMLARAYTAAELARLGVINYAVPADQLDAVVDDIVSQLLRRNPYSLAWTKRLANKRVLQHLALTLDASTAYERINWLQLDRLGGAEERTF